MASVALPYQLLFLYIEPLVTLTGAFYAAFRPSYYLDQTHLASAPSVLLAQPSTDPFDSTIITGVVPLGIEVVLQQLGNLYLLLAVNEFLILRFTSDLRVWKVLLASMLIGDFGHLWACRGLGLDYYWQWWTWNAMAWGNTAFIYLLAVTRTAFLLDIGVSYSEKKSPASSTMDVPATRVSGKSKLR